MPACAPNRGVELAEAQALAPLDGRPRHASVTQSLGEDPGVPLAQAFLEVNQPPCHQAALFLVSGVQSLQRSIHGLDSTVRKCI